METILRTDMSILPRADNPSSRPLRLVIDLSWLRPGGEAGGVKPCIFEYLRELAALEGDRIVYIFLTWSCSHADVRSLARPQDEMICVRHTEPEALNLPSNAEARERFLPSPPLDLLVQLEADVLYAPLGPPQFACPGIPILSKVVDVLHRDFPGTLAPEINAQRETIFEYLVRITDRFQCNSQYTAGRLHHHFGVPLERMFCSYIPIHHRFRTGADEQSPPVSSPYFFYPANSWKHKNHEMLLSAFRHYRAGESDKPWDLVLTGHEDERMRQILAFAKELGIAEQVHFFGHLPERGFSRVWRHAGALVFPSLHEGFGIPLLEAMHFGIPILSSRAGSLGEIAENAALYADAQDPVAWAAGMSRLARDASLRSELVARGRQRLTQFSLTEEIAEFRDAIRSLAADGPDRNWLIGLHGNGYLPEKAILCLPKSASPGRITLRLKPSPTDCRLLVRVGLDLLGDFELPASNAREIELKLDSTHRSLVLDATATTGAARPSSLMIASVRVADSMGCTQALFEAP
jgi:glycosyltransferase involved in cell wall biosynthesis